MLKAPEMLQHMVNKNYYLATDKYYGQQKLLTKLV